MNYYPLLLFVSSLFLNSIHAQDINALQMELETVEAAKKTFRQNLKPLDDGLVEYNLVEVDPKGNETESVYRFSFSDIDDNTVRSITKKDVIIVQLLVEGKQKLIQKITDGGDKISYISDVALKANNTENGTKLENVVKAHIPEAMAYDQKRLSLNSYKDYLNWLLNNVSDIEFTKKQIVQKINANETVGKLILDQTFISKNKTKNELREFNLATLDLNSVGYKISGDELIISVDSRRSINGIKYIADGEQKNYANDLKIYATSITNAKDILKVLKNAIPLAETAFNENRIQVDTEASALQFLNKAISEITASEEIITQNLTIENSIAQLKRTETKPDESTEFVYNFNFGDVNTINIDFNGQKDKLFAVLPIKKSANHIQVIKNGGLENYKDIVKVYFNTIEDAMVGVEALKFLATQYETKLKAKQYTVSSLSNAVKDLKNEMQEVKIGEDAYDLFIELQDSKANTLKVTTVFSNLKKSTETIQEFSIANINPKNCVIQVKGKHVIAELNTKHLEKIVKTYVDGEIKAYQYKIGIEAKGIEEARQIVMIFKKLAEEFE